MLLATPLSGVPLQGSVDGSALVTLTRHHMVVGWRGVAQLVDQGNLPQHATGVN